MNGELDKNEIEDDAAKLGLAVLGQASALHAGDDESLTASEDNIRETVGELVDQPLTDRQEEVVETLAASSASLAAGLAGAVAAEQDRPVNEVLEGAARAILMQQQLADGGRDNGSGSA